MHTENEHTFKKAVKKEIYYKKSKKTNSGSNKITTRQEEKTIFLIKNKVCRG